MRWFLISLWFVVCGLFVPPPAKAQSTCDDSIHVSPALTDFTGPYQRLKWRSQGSTAPAEYEAFPDYSGGLYPYGANVRPPTHEAAGVAIANQIQPLDTDGDPDPNGQIGMLAIGMSNTKQEFDTFLRLFDEPSDPHSSQVNPQLKVVDGALGGGVLEIWSNPNHQSYPTYWQYLDDQLTLANLDPNQVQIVWIKITEMDYLAAFPDNILRYEDRIKTLIKAEVYRRFPYAKITYLSSRTRAHAYHIGNLNPEPYSFETGLGVRAVIEDQLNGTDLNYDPAYGPVIAPYLSWGPYLWIDGLNPRLTDGRTWTKEYVFDNDCVHPMDVAKAEVAAMLWEFFSTDTTTTPWFLADELPTPTPTPLPTPSPTPLAGDYDDDGDRDLVDLRQLLGSFGSQNDLLNLIGTGLIDIFDFNFLVQYL
ncbi:hypothetical protein A2W24_03550 [Microgenomates group bacterium RBG_16_45_19]|nr:MAG: hypothetical protein A2W24_03550 [Microgenomates group bacterium RBG_16_45_19]